MQAMQLVPEWPGLVEDRPIGSAELRSAIERWHLTAREAEVVAMIAEGESNKEIANRLDRAARTIEVHVSAILKKAKADSRARLVALFWTRR